MNDSTFARDIDLGLSAASKYISSKYFYDNQGSDIFKDIMKMPEYYPTACEFEILSMQGPEIGAATGFDAHFDIVEFGAGDGIKTRQLLKHLAAGQRAFTYIPIDISSKAIDDLVAGMEAHLPGLDMKPMVGNYFSVIRELAVSPAPKLYLFLGGNIGNYERPEVHHLLAEFRNSMKPGDHLLTGFDLRKNPATIRCAYDDPAGITRAFNLNLLKRINRELGGNFDLEHFEFYSHYNPANGEVRSYLVSLRQQHVFVGSLNKSFQFQRNETIATELSKKYNIPEIEDVAENSGFQVVRHFYDCKEYFTDSLWRAV